MRVKINSPSGSRNKGQQDPGNLWQSFEWYFSAARRNKGGNSKTKLAKIVRRLFSKPVDIPPKA